MVRTRYAPSPTGYMHCGNLRTALFEYLVAKCQNGTFALRIEDTDKNREVDGSIEIIYETLKKCGIKHDEGPDIGGPYGPYIQSERKSDYLHYAKTLVDKGAAYYCFCDKETLDEIRGENEKDIKKYDRRCMKLSQAEIRQKLDAGVPYVIRQLIPEGETSFTDEVYGTITVKNSELDDQILVKSDGLPTYNFANVVDDHTMDITHVVRGSEYLSSTPKYNILYNAFGWDVPVYVHLPLILNEEGGKMSKRKGDATFEDLMAEGYLPEAVVNFIALLGWSPTDNNEFFTLAELERAFDPKHISKSPSSFDMKKLTWMNSEYIKRMDSELYYEAALPYLKEAVKSYTGYKKLAAMTQSRVEFVRDCGKLLTFIDELPEYSIELYVHKKMKTDTENSLSSLKNALTALETVADWNETALHEALLALVERLGIKNGQMLWPIRTALSGMPQTPCGATELLEILGREESIRRINIGISKLEV